MREDGVFLSHHDLEHLTQAANILHDPFGYGTLDGWRAAVNEAMKRVVQAEVALFFVRAQESDSERGPVHTDDLSADECSDFVREALFDAGSDRALAWGLSAFTQRGLIGDDWQIYISDPSVNRFYLPKHLLDSVGLMTWDRTGQKEASIEMHRSDFGAPIFGDEGCSLLRLLLPAFRAGIAAVRTAATTRRGTESLLEGVGQAVALADAHGRITFRSSALNSLLDGDPQRHLLESALDTLARSHAGLFEARGWGRRHRSAIPSLEAALAATATAVTPTGRYQLSVVEAPASVNGGRHGFLLRVEPMFVSMLSGETACARFGLTVRELHVARLLAAGLSNERISAALGISPHTARRHTEKVLRKVGVTSRSAVGQKLRDDAAYAS
jgi:DNA-binding CsgD family transcriptional regulator